MRGLYGDVEGLGSPGGRPGAVRVVLRALRWVIVWGADRVRRSRSSARVSRASSLKCRRSSALLGAGVQAVTPRGMGRRGLLAGRQPQRDVPFDINGTLEVGSAGVNGVAMFFGQSGSFDGSRRRIVSGDFQIVEDGEGTRTFALNGRVAWEQLISEDVMLGPFLGGGYGESSVAQGLSGTISKTSLSFGSYLIAEPIDDLYLDGFVSLGWGRNDVAIGDQELDLDGDYDTRSILVGGAVSGVIERQTFEIRPELSVAYGVTNIGDASLKATAFGTSDEVLASIDGVNYATVRVTPEILVPLHRLSGDAALVVAPSLLCEWADGGQDCGGGLRLGLHGATEDGLTSVEVSLDADLIGATSRIGFSASIEHRF